MGDREVEVVTEDMVVEDKRSMDRTTMVGEEGDAKRITAPRIITEEDVGVRADRKTMAEEIIMVEDGEAEDDDRKKENTQEVTSAAITLRVEGILSFSGISLQTLIME